jgi:hypothetical protein
MVLVIARPLYQTLAACRPIAMQTMFSTLVLYNVNYLENFDSLSNIKSTLSAKITSTRQSIGSSHRSWMLSHPFRIPQERIVTTGRLWEHNIVHNLRRVALLTDLVYLVIANYSSEYTRDLIKSHSCSITRYEMCMINSGIWFIKLPKPIGYYIHHKLWHSKILHSSP